MKMNVFTILYEDENISQGKNQIQKNFEKNMLTTRTRIEKITKFRNQLYIRLKKMKNN